MLLSEKDEGVRQSKCLGNKEREAKKSQIQIQSLISKKKGLLSNPRAKFDNDQALVLCQMYGFGAGVQLLYQKMEVR